MGRIIYCVIILLLCRGVLALESPTPASQILNTKSSSKFDKGTQAMIDRSQINGFPRSAQNELEKDILITTT
jgi:hypothetical protein